MTQIANGETLVRRTPHTEP